LAWGRGISISTIITTISIYEIDFMPIIVCVELKPEYHFEDSCMFVVGTLYLFGGEIIYLDCVVIIMLLVHIMFDTCEQFPAFLRAYDDLAMIPYYVQ
jgi:hypothetical protein